MDCGPAGGKIRDKSLVDAQDTDDFRDSQRHNDEVHEQIFSKLNGIGRGADNKISAEITAVHSRVNAIEKSIGGLEASNAMQNQQLARMDAKIDRLIERK